MTYIQGNPLKQGDKIGLTAPAGPVSEEKLNEAISVIKEMGFDLEVGLTCYQNFGGYLAGPPELRANELNHMFANPEITAIFCLRGGYGSAQILPLLNYDMISRHPKHFIGYSDITALHIALQQRSKLATIHGPMPASDLIGASDFTKQSFLHTLIASKSLEIDNPPHEKMDYLVPGEARGVITGGNLTVITSLLGTSFEIETAGKILFLEDIGEEPYRVDRMLTQLALSGKLQEAEGFILGSWTGCTTENKEAFTVEDLFRQIIVPIGKPTICNLRAGHCKPSVTLPFGREVFMQAEEGLICIH